MTTTSNKLHTCHYFKGIYMYGWREYRIKNGKKESIVVCFGVGEEGDKDDAPLNKYCAECEKYALGKKVDEWCRGE